MLERHNILLIGALLLCVALPAAGQVADPGHALPADRTHAPATDDCSLCHSCENPTRENPCLETCPRHTGHFYGDHASGDGPEVVIIDQLANLYRPVVFAHKLHAEMSAMTGGCTNCHHYSETTGEIPPCRECHDVGRPTDLRQPALKGAYHRQCINCHLDWSHANACGFCHEEADTPGRAAAPVDSSDIIGIPHPLIEATPTYTYETPYEKGRLVSFHHEDHVDQFGLNCVDCHRGDSCRRCHDLGNDRPQSRIDHVTTCGACHRDRDCGFCHADEAKPRFEHTHTAGWALEPYHVKVACTTCHGPPRDFRMPSDRCVSCHIHWEVGNFDHAVTGLRLNDDHIDLDCGDCHLDMNMAAQPACTDCHDDQVFPEQLPGDRIGRR